MLGLMLLGVAVSTNFIALALAPVSAVQAMSVVALAASAGYGVLRGTVTGTRQVGRGMLACMVGVLGFVWVIAAHLRPEQSANLHTQLTAMMAIQTILTLLGVISIPLNRHRDGRALHLSSLIFAAIMFASITGAFKVLVELTLRDGVGSVLTHPTALIALATTACTGVVAGVLVQRAHRELPAPVIIAGLTITDTIASAALGIVVLRESSLTPLALVLLAMFALLAAVGVAGLSQLRRTCTKPPSDLLPPQSDANPTTVTITLPLTDSHTIGKTGIS